VDTRGRNLQTYVAEAEEQAALSIKSSSGCSLAWPGQKVQSYLISLDPVPWSRVYPFKRKLQIN